MSRLAKKPIELKGTDVSVNGNTVTVKGAKGTLTRTVHPLVEISVDTAGVMVAPKDASRFANALTGTYVSHVRNMVSGVSRPFEKKLILEGVGYRMEIKGRELILTVGFSHPVRLPIPEGIIAALEKNVITLSSPDKELVGQFAANIRRVKPPEPYLGKGIRYADEVVRRKQGKKAV